MAMLENGVLGLVILRRWDKWKQTFWRRNHFWGLPWRWEIVMQMMSLSAVTCHARSDRPHKRCTQEWSWTENIFLTIIFYPLNAFSLRFNYPFNALRYPDHVGRSSFDLLSPHTKTVLIIEAVVEFSTFTPI